MMNKPIYHAKMLTGVALLVSVGFLLLVGSIIIGDIEDMEDDR